MRNIWTYRNNQMHALRVGLRDGSFRRVAKAVMSGEVRMAELQKSAGAEFHAEDDMGTTADALACCLTQLAQESEEAGLSETADLIRAAALEEVRLSGARRH